MTGKQLQFVEYYLGIAKSNATEAARLAGYSRPVQSGLALIRTPAIQVLLQGQVAATTGPLPANRVLERLSAQASGSMAAFISFDAGGVPFIDLKKAADAGQLSLIKKISQRGGTWEIELYDAQAALVQLGRHYQLFTDQVETTRSGVVTIEYVHDWKGI